MGDKITIKIELRVNQRLADLLGMTKLTLIVYSI